MEAPQKHTSCIQLIVGLGNPGAEYLRTWHNLGFSILDYWAQQEGLKWEHQKRFGAEVARLGKTWLLKPQGFMNRSGDSVGPFCEFYRLEAAQTLVLYDDIRLPVWEVDVCSPKSAGGHNGMRSVLATLGKEIIHFRIGIGPKPAWPELAQFVLSKIPPLDFELYNQKLPEFIKKLKVIVDKGVNFGMNGRVQL